MTIEIEFIPGLQEFSGVVGNAFKFLSILLTNGLDESFTCDVRNNEGGTITFDISKGNFELSAEVGLSGSNYIYSINGENAGSCESDDIQMIAAKAFELLKSR